MSYTEQIMEQLKTAMKAKDQTALDTLRGIKSALGYKKVELGRDLEEDDELQVLQKEANKRKEAALAAEDGGRTELAEREKAQLAIIQKFLPEAMGEAEITERAKAAIAETGASAKKDMGKVMKVLMPALRGKADGKLVNKIVSSLLE